MDYFWKFFSPASDSLEAQPEESLEIKSDKIIQELLELTKRDSIIDIFMKDKGGTLFEYLRSTESAGLVNIMEQKLAKIIQTLPPNSPELKQYTSLKQDVALLFSPERAFAIPAGKR